MTIQCLCGFPAVLRCKKAENTICIRLYSIIYHYSLFFYNRFTRISQGDNDDNAISKKISDCFRFSMAVDHFFSAYHNLFFTAVSGWRFTFTRVPRIERQSVHRPSSVFDPDPPTNSSLHRPAFTLVGCIVQWGTDLIDKSMDLWKNSHPWTMPAARQDAPSSNPKRPPTQCWIHRL